MNLKPARSGTVNGIRVSWGGLHHVVPSDTQLLVTLLNEREVREPMFTEDFCIPSGIPQHAYVHATDNNAAWRHHRALRQLLGNAVQSGVQRIHVHCGGGNSRSSAAAILARKAAGQSHGDAFHAVMAESSTAFPNLTLLNGMSGMVDHLDGECAHGALLARAAELGGPLGTLLSSAAHLIESLTETAYRCEPLGWNAHVTGFPAPEPIEAEDAHQQLLDAAADLSDEDAGTLFSAATVIADLTHRLHEMDTVRD